jgi:hypothetical protein
VLGFRDFLESAGFFLSCFGGLLGFVFFDIVEELAGEGAAGLELFGLLVVVFRGDVTVGFLIDEVFG